MCRAPLVQAAPACCHGHTVLFHAATGEQLISGLTSVMEDSRGLIRAVRGRGLWVSVEFDPARVSGREIIDRLAARGVLSPVTHETVIGFAAPLTISEHLIEEAIGIFRQVIIENCVELGLVSSASMELRAKIDRLLQIENEADETEAPLNSRHAASSRATHRTPSEGPQAALYAPRR